MSVINRANPFAEVTAGQLDECLTLDVYPEGDTCVVHAAGELDLAGRNKLFTAATAGHHPAMVIDLAAVTFMDCSGYGSLVACRLAIEGQGRTLKIRGDTGQPARLLEQIATMERRDAAATQTRASDA